MTLLDQHVLPRLRDYWLRLALRRVHYADRADRLDRLYCIEDPWHMGSAKEQARFTWTNALIAACFGRPHSLLEIGCGEGHQSRHLATLCGQLYGLDVSARAVKRARRRCPDGRFAAGDPFVFGFADAPAVFDLAAACEMIYYVKDVPRFIARLSELGRACLVTYYDGQAPALDPYFANLPETGRDSFRHDGVLWHAVWWHSPLSSSNE